MCVLYKMELTSFLALAVFLAGMIPGVVSKKREEITEGDLVTHAFFCQVSIAGRKDGHFAFGLFGELALKTVEHFMYCALEQNKYQGYRDTLIHRVVKGYYLQGGILKGTKADETCDENSILGGPLENESYKTKQIKTAWLGMLDLGADKKAASSS
ncbi:uncharacterized protein [Amphiura filiformis]|uniref:uncharacterized protein isoform X2 n=1 Tax=Amphiura filiformis TaxID=82378 RepID=UPI003B21889F